MITQQKGRALGSEVIFTLNATSEYVASSILAQIRNFLCNFENRFSRFKLDSEVTKVNLLSGSFIAVSDNFLELARIANKMQLYTDGRYNPLLLPDLQRAGYIDSWPDPDTPSGAPDYSDRPKRKSGKMVIRSDSVKIPISAAIDFGGIGKGYALDKIAEIIEANGCTNYWVSLGGDIIGRGVDEWDEPWKVELPALHDKTAKDVFYTIPKKSRQAIATSSILRRRGRNWHHIIDPATGKPAVTEIESAVVVSKSGIISDVIAKCLIISNKSAADFWNNHQQIDAYIQYADKYERLVAA